VQEEDEDEDGTAGEQTRGEVAEGIEETKKENEEDSSEASGKLSAGDEEKLNQKLLELEMKWKSSSEKAEEEESEMQQQRMTLENR
jgi:hypothetical protein